MNTIIVPVDFTDASKRRASFALDMARKFNSKIIFSHAHNVIFSQTAIGSSSMLSNSGVAGTLTQQRLKEQELADFVNNLDDSVTILNHVGIGSTESVLNKLIEKEGADLVVIGASDESSIENLILGDPNDRISRKVSCSVLVLPEKLETIDFNSVSLALDPKWYENEIQMNTLFNFLRVYGSELDIINVSEDGKKLLREKQVLEQHRESLDALNYSFHTIYADNVKKGILRFLQKQSSDLLTIIYRRHGFFKRIFDPGVRKQMISDIRIPLLILK